MRLLRAFGQRNAWTSNFSAWVERGSGEVELLYQSFDPFDIATFRYDSAAQNPPLRPELALDGAASGPVMLRAGDRLLFNCHVEFTAQRAAMLGAPDPVAIGQLRFAHEIYFGETCIFFGNTVGGELGPPNTGEGAVPEFAVAPGR